MAEKSYAPHPFYRIVLATILAALMSFAPVPFQKAREAHAQEAISTSVVVAVCLGTAATMGAIVAWDYYLRTHDVEASIDRGLTEANRRLHSMLDPVVVKSKNLVERARLSILSYVTGMASQSPRLTPDTPPVGPLETIEVGQRAGYEYLRNIHLLSLPFTASPGPTPDSHALRALERDFNLFSGRYHAEIISAAISYQTALNTLLSQRPLATSVQTSESLISQQISWLTAEANSAFLGLAMIHGVTLPGASKSLARVSFADTLAHNEQFRKGFDQLLGALEIQLLYVYGSRTKLEAAGKTAEAILKCLMINRDFWSTVGWGTLSYATANFLLFHINDNLPDHRDPTYLNENLKKVPTRIGLLALLAINGLTTLHFAKETAYCFELGWRWWVDDMPILKGAIRLIGIGGGTAYVIHELRPETFEGLIGNNDIRDGFQPPLFVLKDGGVVTSRNPATSINGGE